MFRSKKLTEEDLRRILTNPYYCLPHFQDEHPIMIDEETWVRAGVNLIKEIGAEEYLKNPLENLKGNYV